MHSAPNLVHKAYEAGVHVKMTILPVREGCISLRHRQQEASMIHPFPTLAAALFTGLCALGAPAAAEEATGHEGHAMMGDMSPASVAFMAANDRMHGDMAIE